MIEQRPNITKLAPEKDKKYKTEKLIKTKKNRGDELVSCKSNLRTRDKIT